MNAPPKYTADYFIAKFEAIPDERWCVGEFSDGTGRCCALGHCGESTDDSQTPQESVVLRDLFSAAFGFSYEECVAGINDGRSFRFRQPTPKARILAALREVKAEEISSSAQQ